MAKKPSLTKFKNAVEKYGGCKVDIAKAFKTSRQTVHNWCVNDPEFKEEIDKGNDVLLDLAKSSLKYHLEKRDVKVTTYTLDRLGRREGFGNFIQIQDKSKIDEQLDGMSDEQIMIEIQESRKRIEKANGKK